MSKGYLYDHGDELITRDGNPEFPDVSNASPGDTLVMGDDGEFVVKPGDFVIPVSYQKSTTSLFLHNGITGKDIKDAVEAGRKVVLQLRVQETATSAGNVGSGYIYEPIQVAGGKPYFTMYAALVYVIPGEDSAVELGFYTVATLVSGIADNATYISSGTLTKVTATLAT